MNKQTLKSKKQIKKGKKISTEKLNEVAGGHCDTSNPNPASYCLRPADGPPKRR